MQASLHADRQHDKKVILEALSKEVLGTHKGLKGPELDLWIGDHFESTFAETQEDGEEAEAASDDEEDEEDAADAKEAEEDEEDDGEWKLARGTSPGHGAEDRIYPGTFDPETPKPQKLKLIL